MEVVNYVTSRNINENKIDLFTVYKCEKCGCLKNIVGITVKARSKKKQNEFKTL